jgi:hypothetical protein
VRIYGSCGIYQTTATGVNDYDIEIGTSGTATLYHVLHGFNSSIPTGGIRFIDCGGQCVTSCQFGKLFLDLGTGPAGTGGGIYVANRIIGTIVVEMSNAQFSANQLAGNITVGTGTSGVVFDVSNSYQSGLTITNNGNANQVIVRQVSGGGTIQLKYGDDSSSAIVDVSPSDGTFEFPTTVRVKNNQAVMLEQASGASGSTFAMSTADNLSVTNGVSDKAMIWVVTGTGSHNFEANGARSCTIDANNTAGNTRFMIYDVDNATLERVTVGAADSGGAGFKVLRIPN